jgi:hypothetical protein
MFDMRRQLGGARNLGREIVAGRGHRRRLGLSAHGRAAIAILLSPMTLRVETKACEYA